MTTIAIISNQAFSLLNFRGDLIKHLTQNGNTVVALCPNLTPEDIEQLSQLGAQSIQYKLSRTGLNPITDLATIWELRSKLQALKPDTTLAYFAKPVIYGCIAAHLANIKNVVAMIEGLGYVFTDEKEISLKRKVLRYITSLLYKLGLKGAHRVVFLNNDDMNEFSTQHIVDSTKCSMLGAIGVDLDRWSYSPPPTESVTFIMACRMLKEKGVYEYVRAAENLKATHPNVNFLLAGGTDNNPGSISENELKDWHKRGLIMWLGHVPMKDWLTQSSVFVLPSFYREGVPRSIQEAQACGRPTITTDTPGCRETIEIGFNGILIPPKDTHALSSAMEFFINNPEKITEMGLNARNFAEKHFNSKSFDARLSQLLH